MTCDKHCKNNEEEDDFEIQRLQDIITICEFLIKHKRNQKSRNALDEMLDDLNISNNEEKEEKKNNGYSKVIYTPIYYPMKYRYPWNDHVWF